MAFTFKTAFIGPYAVTLAKGHVGDTQKFRYKVPATPEYMAQGTFVLEGKILANWSSGSSDDQVYDVGGCLSADRVFKKRLLMLNEDLTLTALGNSSYICASAVGIEQRVHVERFKLAAGEEIEVPRYDLLMIGGDSAVRINDGESKQGVRLVYARSTALRIRAEAPSILGTLSFRG